MIHEHPHHQKRTKPMTNDKIYAFIWQVEYVMHVSLHRTKERAEAEAVKFVNDYVPDELTGLKQTICRYSDIPEPDYWPYGTAIEIQEVSLPSVGDTLGISRARLAAYIAYSDVSGDDVTRPDNTRFDSYQTRGCVALVLTDEEADEAVSEYIWDNAWTFSPKFLSAFTGLPKRVFEALREDGAESNTAVLRLIEKTDGGWKCFVREAVEADGRGHFLATFDGEETSFLHGGRVWFIYQQ